MTGKKSCLFPGKSAKPDSSNINPSSSNNAAPSSSQGTGTSFALPITSQANAHPAQDEISEVGPALISDSSGMWEVGSALISDSSSLAHAGRDKVAEIGSPSIPSAPSPEKLRDHAEREANKGLDEESDVLHEGSDVADLYAAFDLISQLADFIKKEKMDEKEKKMKEKKEKKEKEKKSEENKKEKEKENELSEPKLAIHSWLRSKNLLEMKEKIYEAINAAKDSASRRDVKQEVQQMVRHALRSDGEGQQVFNIVFIAVANTWERYEDMSKNEEACLSLLEEINKFAKYVIDLQKVLQKGPESVNEAIQLIIDTCIACCTQIEASKRRRYLRTIRAGHELAKLKKKLQKTYTRIQRQTGIRTCEAVHKPRPHDTVGTKKPVQLRKPDYPEYAKDAGKSSSSRLRKESDYAETIMEAAKELDKENVDGDFSDLINYISRLFDFIEAEMDLCQFDVINQIDMRLRKGPELKYPEYPKDAVGIEDPLREVIERLEMGSDKNAVAVIVHGFGGMGKTTLADAVFARLLNAEIEGYKYSYVRLFDTIASVPDVVKLQRCILTDLMMGEESEIPEIRRYEEGQQVIENMLDKESVFIYIDNVLLPDKVEQGRDALHHLLPKNMRNARKLRLLLTTRDKDAVRIRGVKPVFYPIEGLPHEKALDLFKKTLDGDSVQQLDTDQLNHLVKICEGVPKLMMVVAGFISSEENVQQAYSAVLEAYSAVLEERKYNWKGEIGNDMECYIFAYENLEETLKEIFLDICVFFQGWYWETLSNIVGEAELKMLEKRALVTKDVKSMTVRVHDVMLAIGLDKKGERFRFTRASDFQKFLKKDNDQLEKIKGIWSSDDSNLLYIPASKLDLMHRSLRVVILGKSTEVKGKCKEIFEELVIFRASDSDPPFDVSKLKEFKKMSHLICKSEDLENLSEEKEKEKEKKEGANSPSKPEATRNYWPGSKFFSTLKEVLAEGIEGMKDVPTGDANKIARDLVKHMGMAHLVTTGFLVLANILERYEAISTNKGVCLSVLKEMDKLARHVNELRKRPELKESMVDSIREAIALIVEASLACCTQINATKFSKFFSTTMNGEELAKIKTRLAEADTHMQRNFYLCLYDAIVRRQKPMELQYPEHPKGPVGIEKQLEKVIEMLEMGSDKNAVAVIVHGFGGMGKTTLADAVFARLLNAEIEGYKYSYVRLFDDIASPPNIVELQKFIIEGLKMGEEPKEFRWYEEGQQQIESILAKEVVLIYIDNVLLEQNRNALEELLPKNMGNARKLRLLFTARDKDAVRISGVKPVFYPIEGIPHEEALELFKKTLDGDSLQQLHPNQLKQLVKICEGVPKLIMVVAGFINAELESKQKAYEAVMEESQKNWNGEIGNEIKRYVFA